MWGWIYKGITAVTSGVVSPLFSWLNKKQDAKIEEDKTDGQVIAARASLLSHISNVWSIQLGWAMMIIPTGVWYTAIVVDCVGRKYFGWEWRVLALPDNINYIPYAVVTFLFALAWRGKL